MKKIKRIVTVAMIVATMGFNHTIYGACNSKDGTRILMSVTPSKTRVVYGENTLITFVAKQATAYDAFRDATFKWRLESPSNRVSEKTTSKYGNPAGEILSQVNGTVGSEKGEYKATVTSTLTGGLSGDCSAMCTVIAADHLFSGEKTYVTSNIKAVAFGTTPTITFTAALASSAPKPFRITDVFKGYAWAFKDKNDKVIGKSTQVTSPTNLTYSYTIPSGLVPGVYKMEFNPTERNSKLTDCKVECEIVVFNVTLVQSLQEVIESKASDEFTCQIVPELPEGLTANYRWMNTEKDKMWPKGALNSPGLNFEKGNEKSSKVIKTRWFAETGHKDSSRWAADTGYSCKYDLNCEVTIEGVKKFADKPNKLTVIVKADPDMPRPVDDKTTEGIDQEATVSISDSVDRVGLCLSPTLSYSLLWDYTAISNTNPVKYRLTIKESSTFKYVTPLKQTYVFLPEASDFTPAVQKHEDTHVSQYIAGPISVVAIKAMALTLFYEQQDDETFIEAKVKFMTLLTAQLDAKFLTYELRPNMLAREVEAMEAEYTVKPRFLHTHKDEVPALYPESPVSDD